MKHSDFDRHIQQNASRDLTAPDSLNWDNMDIPLPKKDTKRPLILLLIFSAVMATGGVFYWNAIQNDSTKVELIEPEQIIVSTVKSEGKDMLNNENSERINNNNIQQKIKNTSNNNRLITYNNQAKTENVTSKNHSSHIIKEPIEIEKTNPASISENNVNTLLEEEDNVQNQGIVTKTTITTLPDTLATLSFQQLDQEDDNLPILSIASNKRKKGDWTFVTRMNFTQNHFQSSNSEYLTLLKETDRSAWSQSFSLKKAFPVSPHLFSSVGISYHRLNTVFSYNQYLGSESRLNLAGNVERVHRTRRVYHNNYINISELNLGLGKNFDITNNLTFQIQAGANTGFQLSETGKTLDSNLEIIDKNFKNINRFTLSASTDAHLSYHISQVKLLIGGGFSKYLTNVNSFDNTILTNQPSMFFIDAGISVGLF